VNFERIYSIGKISVGLFIALGLFSISRNLELTARKDKLDILCAKYFAQIGIRNEFQYGLSDENNNAVQDEIKKTSQQLESFMNIKKRIGDKGIHKGKYLYSGDLICRKKGY
tara:strand:- start:588 stop:923 length:336 start_codon:yes stop_codon:yes gene_type:complete